MNKMALSIIALALYGCISFAEESTSPPNGPTEESTLLSTTSQNKPIYQSRETKSFAASFIYYIPDDDDVWDKGYGAEAQLQLWNSDQVGFALSLGWANWDVADYTWSGYVDGIHVAENTSGDASLTPIGVSFLLRPKVSGNVRITLEAGVRYIIADVNAEYSGVLTGPTGVYYIENAEYEADDAIAGVVRANIEFPISDSSYFYVGPGIQFDLSKSEASIWAYGQKVSADISLQAIMVNAGFIMEF